MPITFTIDEEARTIHTTANGLLSYEHFIDHLQAKSDADVLPYAELFDARGVNLDLSLAELKRIGEEVQRAMGKIKPGRIAVVTDSGFVAGLARAYQAITENDNPHFDVFTEYAEAQSWITAKKKRVPKR